MKRIILIGALALLAACGSNQRRRLGRNRSAHAATAATRAPTTPSRSTNFGDMPPQCIDLLTAFLKKIEPTCLGHRHGTTRRLADFKAFGEQFKSRVRLVRHPDVRCRLQQVQPQRFGREVQFQQMTELAAAEAPGTARVPQVPQPSVIRGDCDGRDRSRRIAPARSPRSNRSWARAVGEGLTMARSHRGRAVDECGPDQLQRRRGLRLLRSRRCQRLRRPTESV